MIAALVGGMSGWVGPPLQPGCGFPRDRTGAVELAHELRLGEAVVAMHQRLQGSPMGPLPLSLMARRRG